MKKITFLFLLYFISINSFSQIDFVTALSGASTSQNGRSPQAVDRINRSVWIILAADITASGITNGTVLKSIGFNLAIASEIPVTGNFKVYLQSTTDATNTKSTTWATAITGMTLASDSPLTIPATTGDYDSLFTGGSPFTYTGGNLYVAFEYQNLTGTLAVNPNTTLCNNALGASIKSSRTNTTTPPATLTSSAFRPVTRFGYSVTCARPNYLNVSTTTSTSANLTFTAAPGGGTTEIENGVYNFTPTGTPTTIGLTTNSYNQNGLMGSTAYEYYTRTNCGSGSFSAWNGPFAYNTVFSDALPPYTTGFETGTLKLIDWSTPAPLVAGDWTLNFYSSTSGLTQGGTGIIQGFSSVSAASDNYIFSRGISLTSGSNVTVSYYVRNYVDTGSTNIGSLSLTVGNNRTIAAQTTVVGSDNALVTPTFVLKSYSFTPTYTGSHYFALRNQSPANTSGGNHALLVDTFSVTQVLKNDEFLASKFSISPNPSTNQVNISSSIDALIDGIEITDLNGRIVASEKRNGVSETQITIGDLSQGVYLMKISSDKGIATKKVIKE